MNYKWTDYINREFFNPIDDTVSIAWDVANPFLYESDKYNIYPQFLEDKIKSYIEDDIKITKEVAKKMLNDRYGIRNAYPKAKKVYYDETAGVTVVLWTDNTKTIVRAAEGDKHDAYLGYCTALAKKIHGTNSALKRDLEKVLVKVEKKEKKNEEV